MKNASFSGDSDPRQRLLALAEARGVSLAALSELLGRNPSYLQQFIRKGSPRKLDEQDRATLARFLGVAQSELGGSAPAPSPPSRRGEWADIPRLPLEASAGPGATGALEQAFDAYRFSARWLREQGLQADMLVALSVSGDSMEPLLRDGDEILVDRTPRPMHEGVHVVRMGDVRLVKRIQQGQPGRITLISENPHYPPLDVSLDEVDVIGRVVWKGGRL